MVGRTRPVYEFLDFRLIPAERLLLQNGDPVSLTPKVFQTLVLLVEQRGSLVDKEELLRHVWGDVHIEEANIARSISVLRKALGDDRNGHRVIETVSKRGYRFVAPVAELADGHSEHRPGARGRASPDAGRDGPYTSRRRLWPWIGAAMLAGGAVLVYQLGIARAGSQTSLDPASMRQVRLTQSGDVYAPVISTDGQYLVYRGNADGKGALCLLQISTGNVVALVPLRPGITLWAAVFSRDGKYVYYTEGTTSGTGIIYRVSMLGGQPEKLIDNAVGPYVSPDGERLAFKRFDKENRLISLIVSDPDGSNQQVIASTDTDSNYLSVDWAPDGLTIAYVLKENHPDGNRWYVAEVPATGGPERRIGEARASRIYSALWLPDKSGFAMTALDESTRQMQLFHLSYPDGTQRRITSDLAGYSGISMTADGRSIVAQRMEIDREIWVAPINDRSRPAKQLTFKKAQHFDDVSWLSPRTLVFDVDESKVVEKHDLWSLDIDESEPRRITQGEEHNYRPRVSPDGKIVAFISTRSGRPQIWRVLPDGTQTAPVTDVATDVLDMQFDPSSRTLYFTTWMGGKARLMKTAVSGGPAELVFEDADVFLWALSRDGQYVAYSSRDPARERVVTIVRRLDGGRIEQILDLEPFNCLQWSADGSALYFGIREDGGRNVWRRSLREQKPRPITTFNDNKNMLRFTVSPTGADLAIVRFTENYDAVALHFDE